MARRKAIPFPVKPLTLEQWAQLGDPRAIARLAQMEADAEEHAATCESCRSGVEPGQPGNPVMFADEGDGYVTVLDSGYNPLEYNVLREQAERDYPAHGAYDELGAER